MAGICLRRRLLRWFRAFLTPLHGGQTGVQASSVHIEPQVKNQGGETIAIFGQGPVGLSATQFAVVMGARVIAIDVAPERRKLAQAFGAHEVIDPTAGDVVAAIREPDDRHQVTAFMNSLTGALPGRVILPLAHPARTAGSEFSGSGVWENVARTRLFLGHRLPGQKIEPDEEPDENVRYLARRKANYSNRDWRRFTYRDGVLVPDAAEVSGGIVAHLRDQAAERVVLAGLERLAEMGVTATDGTTSPRYLPRVLTDYKLGEGHGRTELADAMHRLMLSGKLRRAAVGKTASRHPLYGLEAAP